ncbi:unnamed protein product [Symbiodinium natans]|uniref:Uncharacterized protein n=1 Tax=Symbiodinium natans TaxID=878477 RepID=A0A812R350_9DINO|nr:unnamed protein product [Symbiodinium natans]
MAGSRQQTSFHFVCLRQWLGLDERGISRVLGCLPTVLGPAIAYFLVIVYEVRKAGFSLNDVSRVSAGTQMMSAATFLCLQLERSFLLFLFRRVFAGGLSGEVQIKHPFEPNCQVTVNIILVHVAAEGGRIAAVMLAAIQNPMDWQGAILPLCLGVLLNVASRTHLLAYVVMKMGEGMFPSLRAICRPRIQSALLQEVKVVVGNLRYVAILGVPALNPKGRDEESLQSHLAREGWLPPTLFVLAIALEIVEDLVVRSSGPISHAGTTELARGRAVPDAAPEEVVTG